MCRFVFYLGDSIRLSTLLTEPAHSLIKQSFASRERNDPLNGDGFGVGWYAQTDNHPAVFRAISPAWNNSNLLDISRVTQSRCILAHVRDATQGLAVSQSNCHPFKNRKLMFAHNGDIGGFKKIRRHLLAQLSDTAFNSIQGTTDSEHFFALFQDNYNALEEESSHVMASALQKTIGQVVEMVKTHANNEICYFNMLITDGKQSVACRYCSGDSRDASSLYVNEGRRYLCEDGVCIMSNTGDTNQRAVVVSSEPLSQDENWTPIKPNSILLVDTDLQVSEHTIQ